MLNCTDNIDNFSFAHCLHDHLCCQLSINNIIYYLIKLSIHTYQHQVTHKIHLKKIPLPNITWCKIIIRGCTKATPNPTYPSKLTYAPTSDLPSSFLKSILSCFLAESPFSVSSFGLLEGH